MAVNSLMMAGTIDIVLVAKNKNEHKKRQIPGVNQLVAKCNKQIIFSCLPHSENVDGEHWGRKSRARRSPYEQ